jgi:hypothetical protein
MGSPDLKEITIRVNYDADGVTPVSVNYVDQEGCGHESNPFGMETTAIALVSYHLRHADRSHDIRPKRMCRFTVGTLGGDNLTCVLEAHDRITSHRFEMKG